LQWTVVHKVKLGIGAASGSLQRLVRRTVSQNLPFERGMAFESISQRRDIALPDFEEKWLPLISLYDPDLPLFPIQYFHKLDPALPLGRRPGETDRVFGYIQRVNFSGGTLTATVASNKDLGDAQNARFVSIVEQEVRERFGHNDAVTLPDVQTAFSGRLAKQPRRLKRPWDTKPV
jgi:hypothetical protein